MAKLQSKKINQKQYNPEFILVDELIAYYKKRNLTNKQIAKKIISQYLVTDKVVSDALIRFNQYRVKNRLLKIRNYLFAFSFLIGSLATILLIVGLETPFNNGGGNFTTIVKLLKNNEINLFKLNTYKDLNILSDSGHIFLALSLAGTSLFFIALSITLMWILLSILIKFIKFTKIK